VGHLDGSVDAEGVTEGVPCSNGGCTGLGDTFVIQECGENAREEGVVAVIHDQALGCGCGSGRSGGTWS
jgi:hypothetical protein